MSISNFGISDLSSVYDLINNTKATSLQSIASMPSSNGILSLLTGGNDNLFGGAFNVLGAGNKSTGAAGLSLDDDDDDDMDVDASDETEDAEAAGEAEEVDDDDDAPKLKSTVDNTVKDSGASTVSDDDTQVVTQVRDGAKETAKARANTEATVNAQYKQYLGRDGEAGGMKAWSDNVTKGMSVEEVRHYFAVSPEFLARGATNEDFAKNSFKAILNREPSAADVTNLTNMLSSGKSRKDIAEALFNSPEAKAFRNATPAVTAPASQSA